VDKAEAVLDNGLRISVVARGSVPLVAVRLVILAGSCMDPGGKAGLSDFMARLLRRGTARRTADEINEAIEFVGGMLTLEAEEDSLGLSLVTPKETLPRMLDVLAELVRAPAFPKAEVQTERERAVAQFANDLDDPSLLAGRATLRALWGQHPYGHGPEGTARDVAAFVREDVVRFHRERVGPAVSNIYVVGPVEPAAVLEAVRRAFQSWRGGPAAARWPSAPLSRPYRQVVVVDKPEQTQTQVRLATTAFERASPCVVPARVLGVILGAGFTSRLVNEVRVNRGLAYGVNSRFDALKVGGSLSIGTATKTETTGEIIRVILWEVEKLRRRGLRPGELAAAKRFIVGLYPLRTERNESLASVLGDVDTYGLGPHWVERYRDRVKAVTAAQVMSVAREVLFVRPPVVVVVGNAKKVVRQLSVYGKPTVLEPAGAQ
jgi:zinc protease